MLVPCALIIALCFVSCGYFADLSKIEYHGRTYIYARNWYMKDGNLNRCKTKNINSNGVNTSIRVYDYGDDEFIFGNDMDWLYHDADIKLPDNNLDDIENITLFLEQDVIIKDAEVLKSFFQTVSSDNPQKNVNDVDGFSFGVYYHGCPAYYLYGWIVLDKNDNYWIRHQYTEIPGDSNLREEFFQIDDNSALMKSIRKYF